MEILGVDGGACCGWWCCSDAEDNITVHFRSHIAGASMDSRECVYPCRCVAF
jgi:hypothetical protein